MKRAVLIAAILVVVAFANASSAHAVWRHGLRGFGDYGAYRPVNQYPGGVFGGYHPPRPYNYYGGYPGYYPGYNYR